MGLFDNAQKSDKENAVEKNELVAYGWDAITKECERVYPTQTNPKHYGTLISWQLGGSEPLDGISIYDGGDYWHFAGDCQNYFYTRRNI